MWVQVTLACSEPCQTHGELPVMACEELLLFRLGVGYVRGSSRKVLLRLFFFKVLLKCYESHRCAQREDIPEQEHAVFLPLLPGKEVNPNQAINGCCCDKV